MADHRQSALLLHGLTEADQRWVLDRLALEDQRILGDHLTELENLGIPADPALSNAAAPRRRWGSGDGLQKATPAQIQVLLADEPVWLIRQVLAIESWPWRRAYLASLSPIQQERLTANRPVPLQGKAAERLRSQLALRISRIDRTQALGTPAEATPNGLRGIVQKVMRRWL